MPPTAALRYSTRAAAPCWPSCASARTNTCSGRRWASWVTWLHSTPSTGHMSHLTPHTSHLTPHTSHLTPHTSHLTPHTSLHSFHHSETSPRQILHRSQEGFLLCDVTCAGNSRLGPSTRHAPFNYSAWLNSCSFQLFCLIAHFTYLLLYKRASPTKPSIIFAAAPAAAFPPIIVADAKAAAACRQTDTRDSILAKYTPQNKTGLGFRVLSQVYTPKQNH